MKNRLGKALKVRSNSLKQTEIKNFDSNNEHRKGK